MNLATTDKKNGFPLNMRLLKTLQDQRLALEKLCNLFGSGVVVYSKPATASGDPNLLESKEGYTINEGELLKYKFKQLVNDKTTTVKHRKSIKQDDLEGSRSECFKEDVFEEPGPSEEGSNFLNAFRNINTLKLTNSIDPVCSFVFDLSREDAYLNSIDISYILTDPPGNFIVGQENSKTISSVKFSDKYRDKKIRIIKKYLPNPSPLASRIDKDLFLELELDQNYLTFAETVYDTNLGNAGLRWDAMYAESVTGAIDYRTSKTIVTRLIPFRVKYYDRLAVTRGYHYVDYFKDPLDEFENYTQSKVRISIFKLNI